MFIAIDPGTEKSAFVHMDGGKLVSHGIIENDEMVRLLINAKDVDEVVIEMIASFGMPVGAEIFESCVWIGQFIHAAHGKKVYRLFRNEIKNHLCHSSKANDANIRQALIDRFGGKDKAVGTKKAAGPLYGVSKDVWAALAVACTWNDIRGHRVTA